LPGNRALRGNNECQSKARATGRETDRERELYNREGLVLLFPGLHDGPLTPIHPIELRIQKGLEEVFVLMHQPQPL